jgi:acyl-CoA thioesterase-2
LPADLEKLLTYLQVEQIDKYLFIGRSPKRPARVFGGQVLAQALNAAIRTVDEERQAHSMHAYFLRPGDPSKQIVYEVDPIRNGRTFTTRRVVAKQNGRAIFNTSVSFHEHEQGLEHQFTAPQAPDPESLESDREYWERMAQEHPGQFRPLSTWAIDRRPVNRRDYLEPENDISEPATSVWMRAVGELEDNPIAHQTLLAYMSDMTLLGVALRPHPITTHDQNLMFASLDHALWFHQPLRSDEWLLYDQDSPVALSARGFTRGCFYNQQGALVASVAQEVLMRQRRSL